MSHWSPEDKIVKARIDFIYNDCVFLGNLALRLKLVDATEWCPTAATDFKNLYYNRDLIDRCTLAETKFIIAHEVMHCVYDHFNRRNGRDPRLYNCAGDYVINLELKDLGIGEFPSNQTLLDPKWVEKLKEENPQGYKRFKKEFGGKEDEIGILVDEKYRGKSSEEVYDMLREEMDQQQQQSCQSCGGSGEQENDETGESEPCDDCGGSGKQGGYGGPMGHDMHIDPQVGSGDEDEEGKGPESMSQEEYDRLSDDMKKAIMDAAKVAESARGGAGRIPGGVKRLIEEWTDSTVNWRDYLNNVIQSTLKSDYTWQRQSRKSMAGGYYLPAMDNDDMVSVDMGIDTSGSMTSEMLKDILGEVKGIMEQFADFRLRVWCFDTRTYKIWEFGPDTLDDIYEFQLEGGGGTLFECNWEMMREEEIMPDQLIICTDGYPCGSWGEEDYCETVFLVHGHKDIVAPFGITVHHEKALEAAKNDGY
jgi:predicted metal-dependent peptidase